MIGVAVPLPLLAEAQGASTAATAVATIARFPAGVIDAADMWGLAILVF